MDGGALARFCVEPDASIALVVELGTGAAEDDILLLSLSFFSEYAIPPIGVAANN